MKVIHIITGLHQGGAEAMLEKMITAAGEASPDVRHEVISLTSLGVVGPRLLSAGIPVRALGMGGPLASLGALFSLWRALANEAPTAIVQTWLYHADLLGGVVARLAGRRLVVWNLRVAVHRPDFTSRTFRILQACAALSRRIPVRIICCGPVVQRSHTELGYDASRCQVLANGFDLEKYRPNSAARQRVRRTLGLKDDEVVVGTVARLHIQKGYPSLARAAAAVAAAAPKVKFLWIGAGVDTDPELQALIDVPALQDRVIRLGLRSDIPDLLVAMDVYCLAARSEGFPNVLGEAMACALPCVSTDAGDAAFVLGSREHVVPIDSPGPLGNALVRMISMPAEQREAIGIANRARVVSEFSVRTAWMRYDALYRSLAAP